AFLKTWEAACGDWSYSTLLIPSGKTFLLSGITFSGPCKNNIHVQLSGNITAPNTLWTREETNLVTFININNLTLDGGGQIDGQGSIWWDCYSKHIVGFLVCNNLWIKGINLKNSPSKHMTFYACNGVFVDWVFITAPGDSPNTDGILVADSHHVQIQWTTIGTGDDCIAILSGSSDVNITGITCGPGHGISVGSLGGRGETAKVERIHVSYCNIFQALTGARIKTWQGGAGYAKEITFKNINMSSVQTPIDIDQNYCPSGNCPQKPGAVAISNVEFMDIHGTSADEVAVKLDCSDSVPCRELLFGGILLTWEGKSAPAKATAVNAYGKTVGMVTPPISLK
ncbi:Polygalacturonase QRT2, partial [Ananas comosus]